MFKQLNNVKSAFLLLILPAFMLAHPAVAAGGNENATPEPAGTLSFLDKDVVLGDPDAPVEIIEYASMTCGHCANFHKEILPELKKKYIDTGKAKLVFRSFMLNAIDLEVSMISRCVPEKRFNPFLKLLFSRQNTWFQPGKYREYSQTMTQEAAFEKFTEFTRSEVEKIAVRANLKREKMDQCIQNQDIRNYLLGVHKQGIADYQITGTPTVIVNGKKVEGGATIEAITAAVDKAL